MLRSIRSRLLLVIALGVAPALVVLLGLLVLADVQTEEQTRRSVETQVQLHGKALDTLLGQTRGLLSALAAAPVMRSDDGAAIDRFLHQAQAVTSTDYTNLGMTDRTGALTHSVIPATESDLSDHEWFDRAISVKSFAVGSYEVSRISGAPILMSALPILAEDRTVRSVLFASIPLSRLEGLLPEPSRPTETTLLLDSTGRILARKPAIEGVLGTRPEETTLLSAIRGRRQGTVEADGTDGVRRLYAFAPAYAHSGSTIYIASGVSTQSAYSDSRRTLLIALALVLLGGIVAAVSSWVAADRSVIQPLHALSRTAHAFSAGDLSARSNVGPRRDEIGHVADEFDKMAASLQAHVNELEGARRELAETNVALDERVRQRTAELLAANKELEAFSYSVSHDLRAPLRAVDGFSQALLEDYAESIDEQGHEYLSRIRRAANRMGQLIDSLLQLSRLSRTELQPMHVDLTALAREIAEEMQAGGHRMPQVSISQGLLAEGDPEMLRLVLQNLMGNALKFSGGRTDAAIEVGMVSSAGVEAFFVKDNGVGFDMAYADQLFGAFQRLHTTEEFAGLGIGLATVARIVHRHGGEVWAESVPGAGATFYFTLPRPMPIEAA